MGGLSQPELVEPARFELFLLQSLIQLLAELFDQFRMLVVAGQIGHLQRIGLVIVEFAGLGFSRLEIAPFGVAVAIRPN